MKKTVNSLLLIGCSFLFLQSTAQDSLHPAAGHISKTSEQTDNITGRKIQQQSLLNGKIAHTDSIAPASRRKKITVTKKQKQLGPARRQQGTCGNEPEP